MKHPVKYNNLPLRIAGSFAAANFVVLYGTELTFFRALQKPAYYIALAVSFLIALCLTYMVHLVTIQLDRRYNWPEHILARASLQLLLGFAIPALLAIVLAWTYFAVMGVDMRETGYFLMDYPIILLMLFLFNMYYIVHCLIVKIRRSYLAVEFIPAGNSSPPIIMEKGNTPDHVEAGQADELAITVPDISAPTGTPLGAPLFTVHSGLQTIGIDVNREVCFIYSSARKNWMMTFSGDTYMVNQSLTEFEQTYADQFFRINRSVLINFDAIAGYADGKSRRLTIILSPEYTNLPKEDYLVTVSQDNVARFKAWFDA